MKHFILLGFFSLLLFVGCGDNNQSTYETNKSHKVDSKDLLKDLGLNIEKEKLSIDLNQTNKFMKQMEIEMHSKADEITHKIEKADINFSRDIGINISDEKIEIDLNKTKNMFQQINILLKEVLLDENGSKY